MTIPVLLDPEAVIARATATNKRQVLQLVADVAARRFGVDAEAALEGLLERERESSTGLGSGVALPHARLPGLERVTGVFVRLETPAPFDAVDGQPVDLVFALFGPLDGDVEHLRSLARVSRLLRRRDVREQLRSARSLDALRALLAAEAHPSAA